MIVYVHVDVSQVPPVVELRDLEDFTRFSVVVAAPAYAWVDPDGLAELGGRSEDAAWRRQLAGMVRFADSLGWFDERGRVRAHVEVDETEPWSSAGRRSPGPRRRQRVAGGPARGTTGTSVS